MGKLRHREIEALAEGHLAGQWQSHSHAQTAWLQALAGANPLLLPFQHNPPSNTAAEAHVGPG